MSEEIRLSVGIDASSAKDGSDQFDQAAESIIRASERIVDRLDVVAEQLSRVAESANGERMVEYVRTLESAGKQSKETASDTGELIDAVSEYKTILRQLTEQQMSSTEVAKHLEEYWRDARDSLRSSVTDMAENLRRGGEATGDFSYELSLMARTVAEAGDAVAASKLFDMADEFREMEQHIADALTPGSELLKQFEEAAGMTAGEVQNLYNAFGSIVAESADLNLALQNGGLTVEEYAMAMGEVDGRIQSLLPRLAELRNELQFETNAEEAAKEIEDMMDKLGSTQSSLDQFTGAQQQAADAGQLLNNSMTTLGVSAGKLGAMFLRALGITGMSALFYKSMSGASQFADALVRLTNMAGMTNDEVQMLTGSMKELAREFGNSSNEEAAAALAIMSKGYRDAADAVEILAQANQLADATFTSVGAAATSLSQAMAAFELTAKDAKDAAETLAVASGGSAEAMQQMAFMAGRLGAVMNQAGVSLEDYSVAVSALRQGGMENRRAIMGPTQAVGALSNMSTEAKLRFKEYGIAIDEARIANEGLAPILQEIYEKTGGSKQAIQQLMGSQQAATVVMALMRNEGELYAKALENMANKSVLAAEQAERVNNTFTKQADNLQNRLLDRFKNFGTYLLDKLVPIMKMLNESVETVFRTMAALLTLMAAAAAWRAATFAVAGFTKALTAAQVSTSGLRLRLLGTGAAARAAGLSFSGATVQVSAMSMASNIAAKSIVGLATAFNMVKGAMGGWVGMLLTLGVTLYAFKASADSTSKSLSDLSLETKGYAGALEMLNRQELQSEQLKATKALADSKRELLAEETKLADIRERLGSGALSYGAAAGVLEGQIRKVGDLTARTKEYETQLKLVLQALYDINNQTLNMNEGVGKGAGNLNVLNQKELEEAKQASMADPIYAARKKRALLEAQINRFERATNLTDEQKAASTAGLRKELEALNVEVAQLAQKRGVFTEFARGVISGVDPASAALFAYQDKLRQLEQAHSLGLNTESYAQLKAAAEVAYLEASRAAQVYQNELKSVVAATDPVEAAMQAYADAAIMAHKAALAGASDQTIQKFMNQQAASLEEAIAMYESQGDSLDVLAAKYNPLVAAEQQHEAALIAVEKAAALTNKTDTERDAIIASVTAKIKLQDEATRRLSALQEDKLLQLAAQYDPLIANELARTKALIEMEQAVRLMTESEETRALVTEKVGALINEQFDREADGIKGSIKLSREWQVAWEESIKRLDTLFVDLWKSAFQSFESFKDQMVDMAKSLAAEMAHAAFTKPIMVKLAQLFQPQGNKEGVGGTLRELLMGRMGNAQKPLTAPQMANAVEEGTYRGTMKAQSALAAQGLGGDAELLSVEELFGDIGSLYKGTVGDLAEGAKKITEAFESLSVDGLSGTLQKTLAKYFPQAGGAMASAGVVPAGGASGGLWGQISNVPGFGSLVKGLGKFGTTLSAFGTAFQGGLTTFMQGGGYSSLSQLGLGAQSGVAGWGSMAGQAVGGAALGGIAGYGTNMLLGGRGDSTRNTIMSTVGGVVGSLWGPVGSLVGGAVGSLVDNMIGGGEEIKDFGYKIAVEGGKIIGTEYEKIKKYGSMFSSKTVIKESEWESPVFTKIRQQFKAMTAELENVAEVLDVSTEALKNFTAETIKISTKGKKPEQIEAELGQAMIDLQGQQIAALIKDTSAISPMFQQLLGAFTATGRELIEFNPELKKAGKEFKDATHYTEEFIAVFQQLAMMQAALNAVPSAEGQKMLDEANKTLTERYHDMVEATLEVAQGFDGTIEDIGELTAAFVAQRQAAIELAAALKQTQKDISEMFADTALSIRESLMSPQELYESRRTRVDDLSAQLVQTTDPAKLLEISQSINAIVGQLYQGLDETQQRGMAEGFLSFLDGIDAIVRSQTEQGLNDLDTSAAGINEQVLALMTGAATQQTVAANNFADGVSAFVNAVATFAGAVTQQTGGGTTSVVTPPPPTTINFRGATREVNA